MEGQDKKWSFANHGQETLEIDISVSDVVIRYHDIDSIDIHLKKGQSELKVVNTLSTITISEENTTPNKRAAVFGNNCSITNTRSMVFSGPITINGVTFSSFLNQGSSSSGTNLSSGTILSNAKNAIDIYVPKLSKLNLNITTNGASLFYSYVKHYNVDITSSGSSVLTFTKPIYCSKIQTFGSSIVDLCEISSSPNRVSLLLYAACHGSSHINIGKLFGGQIDISCSGCSTLEINSGKCSDIKASTSGSSRLITNFLCERDFTANSSGVSSINHNGQILGFISRTTTGLSSITINKKTQVQIQVEKENPADL
jgi:hypothetical protein